MTTELWMFMEIYAYIKKIFSIIDEENNAS